MLPPSEIANAETLVRCLCSPFHCKNGKLLWKAFHPPRGSDEVSVIRAAYVPADVCKQKGKALADPEASPPKVYEGLAVIAAGAVRLCGAEVADSPHVYEGHADIRHGYQLVDYEPPPPEIVEAVRNRCKQLLKFARFIPDPDCVAENWMGPSLVASEAWMAV